MIRGEAARQETAKCTLIRRASSSPRSFASILRHPKVSCVSVRGKDGVFKPIATSRPSHQTSVRINGDWFTSKLGGLDAARLGMGPRSLRSGRIRRSREVTRREREREGKTWRHARTFIFAISFHLFTSIPDRGSSTPSPFLLVVANDLVLCPSLLPFALASLRLLSVLPRSASRSAMLEISLSTNAAWMRGIFSIRSAGERRQK